jgi:2-hydroxycyclohexanecarboxyl-CoA dehydrogenase
MGRLDNTVAIVTGGGAGIGRGICEVFAEEGARVVVAGRTKSKLDQVVASIEAAGGSAMALACDVNCRDQVEVVVAETISAFGRLDIMVNNAQGGGNGVAGPLESLSEEVFTHAYRGGVLATLYGMQAAFPHMVERGGSMVNMASSTGIMGDPGFAPYGTAKEAIRGLTKHAAREWGRHGIRVNVVAPAALGEGAARFRDEAPRRWEAIIKQIPLGYMGDPKEDIGRGVLALVTDMRYLTGATLTLDGGRCILR